MVATNRGKGSKDLTSRSKRSSSTLPIKTPKRAPSTTQTKTKVTAKSSTAQTDLIRSTLYTFLTNLRENSTICPSLVARKMHETQPALYPDWRSLMEPVRVVVWNEVEQGRAEVTQGGVVRGLEEREGLKGPIRVRRGKESWRDEMEDDKEQGG